MSRRRQRDRMIGTAGPPLAGKQGLPPRVGGIERFLCEHGGDEIDALGEAAVQELGLY